VIVIARPKMKSTYSFTATATSHVVRVQVNRADR
jgi:hypothetical protein